VIVTAELGYGEKGYDEVPPNATIEMQIEMLDISKA
jgi:FKBP-type peptidyl-prolyl cis-trans isomerase